MADIKRKPTIVKRSKIRQKRSQLRASRTLKPRLLRALVLETLMRSRSQPQTSMTISSTTWMMDGFVTTKWASMMMVLQISCLRASLRACRPLEIPKVSQFSMTSNDNSATRGKSSKKSPCASRSSLQPSLSALYLSKRTVRGLFPTLGQVDPSQKPLTLTFLRASSKDQTNSCLKMEHNLPQLKFPAISNKPTEKV